MTEGKDQALFLSALLFDASTDVLTENGAPLTQHVAHKQKLKHFYKTNG